MTLHEIQEIDAKNKTELGEEKSFYQRDVLFKKLKADLLLSYIYKESECSIVIKLERALIVKEYESRKEFLVPLDDVFDKLKEIIR